MKNIPLFARFLLRLKCEHSPSLFGTRAPNERVESSHESKTLNFKVLFIKLEYN